MPRLGSCPHCEQEITDSDLEIVNFKGLVGRHFAYTCKRFLKLLERLEDSDPFF